MSDHTPVAQAESPTGAAHTPFIAASEDLPEFTLKAVVLGALFGVAFGMANAYLGLLAGLTISTSIPVAVMTVAAFRGLKRLGRSGTILEANQAQTIGSASSSVASGVIFTLPALFMWGLPPGLLQMTLLASCGGLLGVLLMVPLRRFLIEREHGRLPYPEGTACAEVLIASEVGGSKARQVFAGLAVGALLKVLASWIKLFPDKINIVLSAAWKAHIGMKVSGALFGVGYILGPRIGTVMVSGGLLSALLIIPLLNAWGAERTVPLYPEEHLLIGEMTAAQLWNGYVRYIGAGAVAAAGIMTLLRSLPTMLESFRIGMQQMKTGRASGSVPRTQRELSFRFVLVAVAALAAVMACVPQVFPDLTPAMRVAAAVCIVLFAIFFVTVASRIVGLVGVTSNPTSGMTIATLLGTATVFWLVGWRDDIGRAATLTVGCVVAIAASIAGDTSQDLKTGFLLGATPRRQQIGELIGVLSCATAICATLIMMDRAYAPPGGSGFGTADLPAPQATLMRLVIDGVLKAQLPWTLIGIGAGIAIVAELARIPSLPFAVGVYLPVSTMIPVFLGGLLRGGLSLRARTAAERDARRETGILLGSGLVGGEGLAGVALVATTFIQIQLNDGRKVPLPGQRGAGWAMPEGWPDWGDTTLALVMFAVLGLWFARRCLRSVAEPTRVDSLP